MKQDFFAQNRLDLLEKIEATDLSIPLRSKGRTKDHCERWSVYHWLSTYPKFDFPIKLIHQDKPDFLLKASDKEIGIEHTEAITQDYAQAIFFSEKNTNDIVVDISLFKWDQKKKASEIYEIANRIELTGPGWKGDSPEKEWTQALYDIVQRKTALLRKDAFKRYAENILLVYDNLPLPYINYSKGRVFLKEALKNYWDSEIVFNKVFVQTDDMLILISQKETTTFKTQNTR